MSEHPTPTTPSLIDHIARAAEYIRAIDARPWRMLIVLGSGLGALAETSSTPVADAPAPAKPSRRAPRIRRN